MKRASALLVVLLLAPALRADEALGLQYARQARERLQSGDAAGALELLDKARTELPGSDVVAVTRGDALSALGKTDEALAEYERALSGPQAWHATFNRGVTRDAAGEALLGDAHVPADVSGLPDGPQPDMLQAIGMARPSLESARQDFLDALDLRDEPQARESVAALNHRLDALKATEDELKKRQQDQDQDKDKQQQQKPDPDQQKPQDQQKPDQDRQKQDQQQQQQEQKDHQDQPQDQPKDDKNAQDQKDQQPSPQDAAKQAQADKDKPPAKPAQELSPEEAQQLLDTLARLEDAARERQKAREARSHRKAEKDW